MAGVSWAQMREILISRGVDLRIGPESVQEAELEAQSLRDYFEQSGTTGHVL